MRIFLRTTFALILLLVLFCAGAVAYGRIQPIPNIFADMGIDDCAGVPCLHGVIPGVTSWDEAKQKLAPYADSISDEEIEIGTKTLIHITLQPLNGNVGYIIVQDYSYPVQMPTLKNLIAVYGYPCQLDLDPVNSSVLLDLIYPSFIIQIDSDTADGGAGYLNESNFIDISIIFGPSGPCVIQKNDPTQDQDHFFTPWLGFRSISYYSDHRN